MKPLRIMIAGGGTGGHVFPMIAVADALKQLKPDCEILFVGSSDRIENKLVPEAGYPLKTLSVSGLKGKSKLSRLLALARLPLAMFRSAFITTGFGPHVVMSGGGYAAWPACWAAAKLGRPLTILEVNSLPGMVSKALSKSAKKAYIAFDSARDHLKCEAMLTGNPIRSNLHTLPNLPGKDRLSILIIGGSQGAVGMNSLVLQALPMLKTSKMRLNITHQAGSYDLDRVKSAYTEAELEANVTEFIDDMADAYSHADLVISRAGATSVAELIASGRPSILVPLPSAADDHQTVNAGEIVKMGGGVVIAQNSSTGKELANQIHDWYDHRSKLNDMRTALLKAVRTDSAETIARDLIAMAEQK